MQQHADNSVLGLRMLEDLEEFTQLVIPSSLALQLLRFAFMRVSVLLLSFRICKRPNKCYEHA